MSRTQGAMTTGLCPRCAAENPGLHAGGPASTWEIAVVGFGLVIVAIALVQAIRFLFRPGEKTPGHIKRAVLDDSAPIDDGARP